MIVHRRVARAPVHVHAPAEAADARQEESTWSKADWLPFVLLASAFALTQTLIGGTRPVFSFPGYGLLALVGLTAVFSVRRVRPDPSQLCLVSSALFFGYILVRATLSPVPYVARTDIYSVLGGLLVYLFAAFVFTSPKQRIVFILFLLVLAVVQTCIGAVQFRSGNNFMPISFLQRHDYGARASGFFVCPNHLAGFLEAAGVFGVSIVCWSRYPTWSKLLIAYATGICYVGVAWTGSRGGYISAAASLFVFAALSLNSLLPAGRRVFWTGTSMAMIAALIMGGLGLLITQKSAYLADRTHNALSTAPVRLDLWHAAIEQWKLRPLFGTGSGTYLYYGREFRSPRIQQDPEVVHNDYLQLLAEYGLVAAFLFSAFLYLHLKNGWKDFRRLGPRRVAGASRLLSNSLALNLGAIASVCAYIVHSFVDFNLHIPANVLLLGFVFGILVNAGVRRQRDEPAPITSLQRLCWALPAIGGIMLIQCVRLWPSEYFAERARIALRDNQADAAADFAERGVRNQRTNPYLFQYLGSARLQQSDLTNDPQMRAMRYDQAREAFEMARALAPRDEVFAFALAATYDVMGRFADSESVYEDALKLDPRSTYAKQAYDIHLAQWRDGAALVQSEAVAPRRPGQ